MLALIYLAAGAAAAAGPAQTVTMSLGDYRFTPDVIEVNAGSPVILTLTNTDTITPHDFVLENEAGGLSIDLSVPARKSASVEFTPAIPGSYAFHCSKKLLFMKSHEEKGMRGTLIVK